MFGLLWWRSNELCLSISLTMSASIVLLSAARKWLFEMSLLGRATKSSLMLVNELFACLLNQDRVGM